MITIGILLGMITSAGQILLMRFILRSDWPMVKVMAMHMLRWLLWALVLLGGLAISLSTLISLMITLTVVLISYQFYCYRRLRKEE